MPLTVTLKSFPHDGDVDFIVVGGTPEEIALLRALRGRPVELMLANAPENGIILRAKGAR